MVSSNYYVITIIFVNTVFFQLVMGIQLSSKEKKNKPTPRN